ncbi:MAG: heme-binding protein, partial [Bradyrhizobium sp.]
MRFVNQAAVALACATLGTSGAGAQTLQTHRIPAALAVEAASETIAECAKQGYHETAVVLDADGAIIVSLRGDGAGIHSLDSAHDKAYTSVSFKSDTLALAERAKGEDSIAPLSKLPHVMFFGGGIVIKLGDETIGS